MLKVLLVMVMDPSAVVLLHCTTVPFSLDVAVNVRVEVISFTVPPVTAVGLARFVRVATKSKSAQFTPATVLQSCLVPIAPFSRNRIPVLPLRYGSTTQFREIPWLTVQV